MRHVLFPLEREASVKIGSGYSTYEH
jgi:hypothetical protein